MVRINVNGLRNVLEACRPLKLKRFVFLSSTVVYGDRDQRNVNGAAPLHKTGDSYNYTKVECERVLREFVRQTGLHAVVLWPPYVYGPGDRNLSPGVCRAIRRRTWTYLDGGRNPFTLVDVHNLVAACLLAATRAEAIGRGFIITDGESITRRELVELICDEMGYERPRLSLARGVGKLLCPLAQGLAVVCGWKRTRFVNRFLYHFAGPHLTFDITKARMLLGYSPKYALRQSLRETARWFKENRPDLLKRD